jgi:hypothetical protein
MDWDMIGKAVDRWGISAVEVGLVIAFFWRWVLPRVDKLFQSHLSLVETLQTSIPSIHAKVDGIALEVKALRAETTKPDARHVVVEGPPPVNHAPAVGSKIAVEG